MEYDGDVCKKCGTKYKRYSSIEIEKRHKEDAEFFGVPYIKGVLACPICKKLKKGEYWLED